MLTIHALIRRLTVTVGLAAVLLTSATLLGPVATADPGPGPGPGIAVPGIPFTAAPDRPLQVEAWGTSARVHVTSAEPALFSVTLTSGQLTTTPSAYPAPMTPTYKTEHLFTLADLRSNTAYTLEVQATTAFGQTLSHSASFTTAKLRARLTLDKIVVHDDGDWLGKGEPTWFWSMTWDKVVSDHGGGVTVTEEESTGGCYPYRSLCEPGSTGEGTLYPTNPQGEKLALLFAEENFPAMPERFRLYVKAEEGDWPHPCLPCHFEPGSGETLHVPKGSEGSVREIAISAVGDGMESTMYFRFETFHDTLPYPPNRGSTRVHHNY